MRILLKFPTRSRPALFKSTMQTYIDRSVTNPLIVVSIDHDDPTMNNRPMTDWMEERGIQYHIGRSRTKIQAINANIPSEGWDILVLGSDDHIPVIEKWDLVVMHAFDTMAPNAEPCQLWFKDIRQEAMNKGEQVCFMPVMNRACYNLDGYIYHPSYESLWCDNEQTEVNTQRGILHRIDMEVFRNESHHWGGSIKHDGLYYRNNKPFSRDERNFKRRKQLGFTK